MSSAGAYRVTAEEQAAIRAAAMTDMEVGLVYDDFQSAQAVDLRHPDVIAGLSLFVSKGLLTEARKQELLKPDVVKDLAELMARQKQLA
ncbi:hypothetical protein [Achromobacter ruhlandii]|uniref:hypothetical protein n=1 Tax=Achromobacter ruhlandii TaxID=72557 RepID=UPI001581CC53|nr:hypothetical protein [Achromobacter ruhlandii]